MGDETPNIIISFNKFDNIGMRDNWCATEQWGTKQGIQISGSSIPLQV